MEGVLGMMVEADIKIKSPCYIVNTVCHAHTSISYSMKLKITLPDQLV